MVFLLDNSLKSLPFEKLLVFNDIDAKSRDVSLFGIHIKISTWKKIPVFKLQSRIKNHNWHAKR